ncbi:hypothetical protein ACWGI8_09295 [Streptomyces sp. NPDC054841]
MQTPRTARTQTGCVPMATGQRWDAVRVPRSVGLTALGILGSRSGAVIEDPNSMVLYWFVAPGSSAGWDVTNTRALGQDAFVAVPLPRRTQGPGPHWRICPGDGAWSTDVKALRAAIGDALDPAAGKARAS